MRHFGIISKPLTNLLKNGVVFYWNSSHEEAFQALKLALSTTLVLALPNFSKVFIVETDASDKGIGAILQEEGHPIVYLSRALGPKNQMWLLAPIGGQHMNAHDRTASSRAPPHQLVKPVW